MALSLHVQVTAFIVIISINIYCLGNSLDDNHIKDESFLEEIKLGGNLTEPDQPNVTVPNCSGGFFGSKCQYKCHCLAGCYDNGDCLHSKCDSSGDCGKDCVEGVDCRSNSSHDCQADLFGLACQYQNLASSAHFGDDNDKLALNDRNDTSCTVDYDKNITLTWRQAHVFTWLRIVIQNESLASEIQLKFRKHADHPPQRHCSNQQVYLIKSQTIDIRCDVVEPFHQITIIGKSICSLYVNGGRNVAMRETTRQSSTFKNKQWTEDFSNSSNAVNGNIDTDFKHKSCMHTEETDTTPYWEVEFSPKAIHTYLVYNRMDTASDRLQGFELTTFKDGEIQFADDDTFPRDKALARMLDPEKNVASLVRISATKPVLHFCEVAIYGECPAGTWGLNCTLCPESCPRNCHIDTGECNQICFGYEDPPNCTKPCPSKKWGINCRETCAPPCTKCHSTNGRCEECHAGLWGTNCENNCTNCASSKCNINNGECIQGCVDGFKPPDCRQSCDDGRYGPNCTQTCDNCNTFPCNMTDGSCKGGCKPKYWGSICKKECSPQCMYVKCDQTSGYCYSGCKSGFQSSECTQGCNAGKYGQNCTQDCSKDCLGQLCHPITGQCYNCSDGQYTPYCAQCNVGKFGPNCTLNCSDDCLDHRCDPVNGQCLRCPEGRYTTECIICPLGKYGTNCSKECSDQCFESYNCDPVNGTCYNGCKDGYTGLNCFDECPLGSYGPNCSQQCSDQCFESNNCNHINGSCYNGCKDGYTGLNCFDGKWLAHQGLSTSSSVAIVFVCSLTIAVVLFLLVYIRRRNNKTDRRTKTQYNQNNELFVDSCASHIENCGFITTQDDVKLIQSY